MIKEKDSSRMVIDIDGPEGNAFVLLGVARKICRKLRTPQEDVDRIFDDMQSGDYANLVAVFDITFGEYGVDVVTSSTELIKRIDEAKDVYRQRCESKKA